MAQHLLVADQADMLLHGEPGRALLRERRPLRLLRVFHARPPEVAAELRERDAAVAVRVDVLQAQAVRLADRPQLGEQGGHVPRGEGVLLPLAEAEELVPQELVELLLQEAQASGRKLDVLAGAVSVYVERRRALLRGGLVEADRVERHDDLRVVESAVVVLVERCEDTREFADSRTTYGHLQAHGPLHRAPGRPLVDSLAEHLYLVLAELDVLLAYPEPGVLQRLCRGWPRRFLECQELRATILGFFGRRHPAPIRASLVDLQPLDPFLGQRLHAARDLERQLVRKYFKHDAAHAPHVALRATISCPHLRGHGRRGACDLVAPQVPEAEGRGAEHLRDA
mmetsp:Transcript_26991/g.77008  ORF Transcript_26991/g.77008 Transcript_26991/m.77008 type:complete len:340 (-) Transcript_26991:684-1703(-)